MTDEGVIHTGGCLCGAVRYAVAADPVAVRNCWCRLCQYIGAGNATVNAFFPTEAVAFGGTLAAIEHVADSGNTLVRQFCPACGVHVTTAAISRPHLIGLRVGTLDEPARFAPQSVIWTSAAPPWARIDPALPQTERQPPPDG